jgi:hypothetical protein
MLDDDVEGDLCEAFDVWQLKKFMGREYMGIVRSTFIINAKGNILKAWDKVKVKGHVEEVASAISIPVTIAPSRARDSAKMPPPQPTSRIFLPFNEPPHFSYMCLTHPQSSKLVVRSLKLMGSYFSPPLTVMQNLTYLPLLVQNTSSNSCHKAL